MFSMFVFHIMMENSYKEELGYTWRERVANLETNQIKSSCFGYLNYDLFNTIVVDKMISIILHGRWKVEVIKLI